MKRNMKRKFITFLLICSMLVPALTASADVLVEPEDDFYANHIDECDSHGRDYYANGSSGLIRLVEEPGSNNEVTRITNGEIIHITFTYNDGKRLWGVAEIQKADTPYPEWTNGWVPMTDLLLTYDYLSFEEEHLSEFYDYPDAYDALKSYTDIVLWSWPGSGETRGTIDVIDDENFSIWKAYKDADGREWGFVGYWQGSRNAWVCLSDPTNVIIPAFNAAPKPEIIEPDDNLSANSVPVTGQNTVETIITVILIAFLVFGTIILIRIKWKQGNHS